MAQVMAGVGDAPGSAAFAYSRRDDILIPSLPHEAALQNAPETDKDFFKVPKVIER
jgi:Asp-tRNA(Asn)/Glu-tRNA(Gln) amidotransferase C subunit